MDSGSGDKEPVVVDADLDMECADEGYGVLASFSVRSVIGLGGFAPTLLAAKLYTAAQQPPIGIQTAQT